MEGVDSKVATSFIYNFLQNLMILSSCSHEDAVAELDKIKQSFNGQHTVILTDTKWQKCYIN